MKFYGYIYIYVWVSVSAFVTYMSTDSLFLLWVSTIVAIRYLYKFQNLNFYMGSWIHFGILRISVLTGLYGVRCKNHNHTSHHKNRKDEIKSLISFLWIQFIDCSRDLICACYVLILNMLYESPQRKPGWRFTAGFEFPNLSRITSKDLNTPPRSNRRFCAF